MCDKIPVILSLMIMFCISYFGSVIKNITTPNLTIPNPIPKVRLNFDSFTEEDYTSKLGFTK